MERGKDHFQIELALRRGLEPVARVPELIIRFRNPSVVFCNAKIASIFESTNTARQRSSAIKGLPLARVTHNARNENPFFLRQGRGKAVWPVRIVASHLTNDVVDRTRPLCPHPQVTMYMGGRNINEADNFVCKAA
jgi:hypothetical protein